MADTQHTRQAKRTPVTLKIKFKSATLDQFIERYSVDVSHGGIFIRTKDPLPVGTQLRFEFQLKDASPLITGEGTVVWTREHDPSRTGVAPGMGVRFDRLADGSQQVLDKILQQKSTKGARPGTHAEFGESATKVAPNKLMQGLASDSDPQKKLGSMAPPRQSFGDERTDATPLPQPMPFHSDADDFPEEAFEESTKVASLDELVARSARPDAGMSDADEDVVFRSTAKDEAAEAQQIKDELAERRARKDASDKDDDQAAGDATAKKPAKDDDAAGAKAAAKAVVATPDKTAGKKAASASSASSDEPAAAKPKAATAKAKATTTSNDEDRERKVTAAAPGPDEAAGGGMTALLAVALVLVMIGGGAYWYLNRGEDDAIAARPPPPVQEPAAAATEEIEEIAEVVPEPLTFTAEVVTEPAGATALLIGGDQQGETPFTFTLPEGQEHRISVDKEGFIAQTITVDPAATGQPIQVALEAMPRMLRIESSPSGAQVTIDGRKNGTTPTEVALTGKLADKDSYAIALSKRGYKKASLTVSGTEGFAEVDDKMVQDVTTDLEERVVAKTTPKKTTTAKTGGSKTNDTKAADTKAADTKAADTKAADTKAADTKAADTKAADTKTADTKTADTKAADTKAADTKADDTKADDTKADDTKTGDTKTGDTKTGDTKTGDTKTDDTKTDPAGPTPDWMD